MLKSHRRLFQLAGLVALAGATAFACSTGDSDDEFLGGLPPSRTNDASLESDATGEPEPEPEPEPEEDLDGGMDAADMDASVCVGKPDGFPYGPGTLARCCGEQPVRLNTVDNCGICGMKCQAGRACVQLSNAPGRWACTCANSNAECMGLGYGNNATCYENICQCRCGSMGTCAGQCKGGTICNDVPFHNFCAHPDASAP